MKTDTIKITVSKDLAPHWRQLLKDVGPTSHYPVAGDRLFATAAAGFRRQASTRLAINRHRERKRKQLRKAARHARSKK